MAYLTSFGQTAEVTPEEKVEILRKVPRSIQNIVDPVTADVRKARHDKEIQLHRREQEEYDIKYNEAIARQERAKEIQFENVTQGRHIGLGNKQVLFTQEQSCEFCSKPCCFVLDGWNGNAHTMSFKDLTIAYDPSFVDENKNHSRRHTCSSDDPAEMFRILDKKIDAMNTKIDKQHEWNQRFYKHQPLL